MNNKITNGFIIGTFVSLYIVVSLISTIHVIDFFKLSNPDWLAISLAIAFEIGAAASLAALIALKKMSKWMVWGVFIILACMQMMGNTFYAYTHLHDFQGWVELFGLNEEELIYQKRVLSIISGAILPLIALGFIKSLVDYIRPNELKNEETPQKVVIETKPEEPKAVEKQPEIVFTLEEPDLPVVTEEIQQPLKNPTDSLKKKPRKKKEPKIKPVEKIEPIVEAPQNKPRRRPGNPQVMPGVN
jgi:hypothetical protein